MNSDCCSPPGGCQRDETGPQEAATAEEQASDDSLATAAIISEDPHAVLVEFSSVVADTQEYIIKVRRQLPRFYSAAKWGITSTGIFVRQSP